MACCKKMAGDCKMGCCKTVSNAPAPVASVQPISQFHPYFAVMAETTDVRTLSVSQAPLDQVSLGLPPSAPPGQNSILRI